MVELQYKILSTLLKKRMIQFSNVQAEKKLILILFFQLVIF